MLDGETMTAIIHDVAAERNPEDSKLTYTDEMLSFRNEVLKEFSDFKKLNPDAELYVPAELPGD